MSPSESQRHDLTRPRWSQCSAAQNPESPPRGCTLSNVVTWRSPQTPPHLQGHWNSPATPSQSSPSAGKKLCRRRGKEMSCWSLTHNGVYHCILFYHIKVRVSAKFCPWIFPESSSFPCFSSPKTTMDSHRLRQRKLATAAGCARHRADGAKRRAEADLEPVLGIGKLYLCIYVSMYLCIDVSMYRCIDVSMYRCIDVSMYLCIYVSMYLCIYVSYVCMYVCIYVCMYVAM